MKTHIIQLEIHDDVISTCDKMGWAKTNRIILVWPRHGRLLYRRLDLVLLQRHCTSLGAQLGLVTKDTDVCYNAPRLGIPVFGSLKKAQKSQWRVPRRYRKIKRGESASQDSCELDQSFELGEKSRLPSRPPRPSNKLNPFSRLVFFTLGALAVLSIAATLLPSAHIVVIPETRNQDATINIIASPDFDSVKLTGEIPAYSVTIIVEGRDRMPVSGTITLPERAAIGYVDFTNLSDQQVEIIEGTVVRNLSEEALRFEVTQSGTVQAGPGELISLPVRSLTPGKVGNLPPDSLIAIEGALGTLLSSNNPQAMRHGTNRFESIPTPQDRQDLHLNLVELLNKTASLESQDNLQPGDLFIPGSMKLIQIIEEKFEPESDQPTDHLELNLRIEYEALIVKDSDIELLARSVLDANLPGGFLAIEDTLITEIQQKPTQIVDSKTQLSVKSARQLLAQISEPLIVRLSLGLDPIQASERLSSNLLISQPPRIDIIPTWWPRLPILPFRITIDYAKTQ